MILYSLSFFYSFFPLPSLRISRPDGIYFNETLKSLVVNGTISEKFVDDSVMRILTPMFQMKLFDRPNRNNVTNNVRSTEHTSLARDIASGF